MSVTNKMKVYSKNSEYLLENSDTAAYTDYELGALPNTIIKCRQINTALRAATLVTTALVEFANAGSQAINEISALTTPEEVAAYVAVGLTAKIKTTKVNNAYNADAAAYADNAENAGHADNATNAANADNATAATTASKDVNGKALTTYVAGFQQSANAQNEFDYLDGNSNILGSITINKVKALSGLLQSNSWTEVEYSSSQYYRTADFQGYGTYQVEIEVPSDNPTNSSHIISLGTFTINHSTNSSDKFVVFLPPFRRMHLSSSSGTASIDEWCLGFDFNNNSGYITLYKYNSAGRWWNESMGVAFKVRYRKIQDKNGN